MVTDDLKQLLCQIYGQGIGHREGFFITEAEARARRIRFPTLAQKNHNPGNLRMWGSYPIVAGYANFPAGQNCNGAVHDCKEGWRALYKQCYRNIFDRGLSFHEFFAGQRDADGNVIKNGYYGFAPKQDGNDPVSYAEYIVDYLRKNGPSFKVADSINVKAATLIG